MMYLAFCTHIIYIYIFKSSLYHCHILKNWWISRRCTCGFGRSYGVGLQPHSCCNADGSEALQPGRRQTWPEYRIYRYYTNIYIYIYYFLKCSINCFFWFHFRTSSLVKGHTIYALYLFVLYICFLMISAFLYYQAQMQDFLTRVRCDRPCERGSYTEAFKESEANDWTWDVLTFNDISSSFLAGWHLWATSSASRQRCQRDLTVLG